MTHEISQSSDSSVAISPDSLVAPAPSLSANEFYATCVDHLLQLDKQLSVLSTRRVPASRPEVLEVARLILLEMVEFSQQHLSGDEFEAIRVAAAGVHESTTNIERRIEKASWNVLKILNSNSAAELELTADYRNLCQDYCTLLADFFVQCVKRFSGNDVEKKSFLQCAESLILEFGRCW